MPTLFVKPQLTCIQALYLDKSPFCVFQQRIREEREAKRATMDGRHDFILSTVAERLGMKQDDAEEFMLDDNQVCNSLTLNSGSH